MSPATAPTCPRSLPAPNMTFFADAFDTEDEAAAALADFENTQRTIIVLTNHPGVPGPRIRAHQVAEILFSD
jgi:hypothetical protein